ncbi:MAG: DNA glycosylase [Eubacteriales bacterium]|nr:DNA glycosylase [Eubacteriales bacterium]
MIREEIPFFNAEKIARSGQCFRWQTVGDDGYTIPAFGKVLRLRQTNPWSIEADCTPNEWKQVWRPYLDLDCDYEAYGASISQQDAYLQAAFQAGWGIRVLHQSLWETMASFIISQNNNIPRIQKSLLTLCGGPEAAFVCPETVAETSEDTLRAAGLGYRAPYLQNAARRYLQDGLSDDLSIGLGEARRYFSSYFGIGPKVADCICLYGLGLKDAFPMDVWVKRILRNHYQGVFPFGQYEGYAGVLQQWMFYYERLLEGRA